jgi:hypothetical protein
MSIGQSAETLLLLSPKLGREKEICGPISHFASAWLAASAALQLQRECKGHLHA